MPFPSTLSTFTRPNAGDKLNSPSHSSVHTAMASIVGQIEAVIGVDGANSVLGTIMSDLRNPDSNGGGHVQTANKGGTGQTAYTKGDILVATSASVLTKLSVGSDGQQMVADSSVATGVKWGVASGSKAYINASVVTILGADNPTPAQSVFSLVLTGSTLGTNNGVRAVSYLDPDLTRLSAGGSVLARAFYGGAVMGSVLLRPTITMGSIIGRIEYILVANNSATAQRGILQTWVHKEEERVTAVSVIAMLNSNTASVNSAANQTMGLTLTAPSGSNFNIDSTIVEKIV